MSVALLLGSRLAQAHDPPRMLSCSHVFQGDASYLEWSDSSGTGSGGSYMRATTKLEGSVTYDLAPLTIAAHSALGSAGYIVEDEENANGRANHQYHYIFNICGDILNFNQLNVMDNDNLGRWTNYTVGQKCRHDSNVMADHAWDGCPLDSNGEEKCDMYLGPAFQYQMSDENQETKCYRLGRTQTKSDGSLACGSDGLREDCMQWHLLDKNDPTAGVILEYNGGDYCEINSGMSTDSGVKKPRKLRLHFECDPHDTDGNIPDEEMISERETCAYDIHLKSRHGCPSDCPISNGKLCGGNGWCGYDRTLHHPRCYCDSLFGGDACSEGAGKSGGVTATGVTLAVVIVLFLAVTGLLGFILHKVRQIKTTGDYGALAEQATDLS